MLLCPNNNKNTFWLMHELGHICIFIQNVNMTCWKFPVPWLKKLNARHIKIPYPITKYPIIRLYLGLQNSTSTIYCMLFDLFKPILDHCWHFNFTLTSLDTEEPAMFCKGWESWVQVCSFVTGNSESSINVINFPTAGKRFWC